MEMQWNTTQETSNSHWAVSEASVLFVRANFSAHCHVWDLCFLFTSVNSWASSRKLTQACGDLFSFAAQCTPTQI